MAELRRWGRQVLLGLQWLQSRGLRCPRLALTTVLLLEGRARLSGVEAALLDPGQGRATGGWVGKGLIPGTAPRRAMPRHTTPPPTGDVRPRSAGTTPQWLTRPGGCHRTGSNVSAGYLQERSFDASKGRRLTLGALCCGEVHRRHGGIATALQVRHVLLKLRTKLPWKYVPPLEFGWLL